MDIDMDMDMDMDMGRDRDELPRSADSVCVSDRLRP